MSAPMVTNYCRRALSGDASEPCVCGVCEATGQETAWQGDTLAKARAFVDSAREFAVSVVATPGYHPVYRDGMAQSRAVALADLAAAGLALREAIRRYPWAPLYAGGDAAALDAFDATIACLMGGEVEG